MSIVNEIRNNIHWVFTNQSIPPISFGGQIAEPSTKWTKCTVLIVCITLLSLAFSGCGQGNAAVQLPTPEVLVAKPVQQDVPLHNDWVATLDRYVNADIRPQVSGYIINQGYKEGSVVRKGQVLFEIDPRPFRATLDRTKGELVQADAALVKSTIDVERDTPLVAQK